MTLSQHGLALGLVLADILLRATRTRCLVPVAFLRVLIVNTGGDAIAALTPARVGGDPVRYLGFRRQEVSGPEILGLFGVEVVSDAIVLGAVAVLLAILFRPAGQQLLAATRHLLATPGFWLLLAAMIAFTAGSITLTRRWLPGALASLKVSLREAWHYARAHRPVALGLALLLTTLSLLARGAILPVLLAGTPGLDPGTVILASAVLVYGQVLAPTPASIGPVELGAVVSLGGQFTPEALATILLVWRGYTLALGVLAGGGLLLWGRRPWGASRPGIIAD